MNKSLLILFSISIMIFLSFTCAMMFFNDMIDEVRFEHVQEDRYSEPQAQSEGVLKQDMPADKDSVEVNSSVAVDEEGAPQIPSEFNLAVPFTPQAPHANWDLPYQEACEEASAYMVWMYFQGEPPGLIDSDIADQAILDLVHEQNNILGDYLDTTAQETVEFIKSFYGLHAEVVLNPTIEQIKSQIFHGYPVIVPAAGRELGNPFFSGQGPLYHMLVLRGYTEQSWITNDPGTRRGEGYVYDIDVIMHAMGDWNNGDPANGQKVVIFVQP